MDERVRHAGVLYEQAVHSGDPGPLAEADRELDAAEADLAVARGRVTHTRFLLGRDQDPAAAAADPGDTDTMAEALRHLGIAAHRAGDLDAARCRLEEATRLRLQTGQLAAAAANMIGLTYIAAAQQRTDDAGAILDEAGAIAPSTGADRILAQVNEARASLPQPRR